jgi:adenosylmethionine-8-amino-7-oxononanoate aminotransferase
MDQIERLRWLDRTVVWHAFSQMAEYDGLIIEEAQGCWLTDIQGKRYLDAASSLWCNMFGHRVPEIDQAIQEQLSKVAHVTNLGMSHPTTIRLAERLVEVAGRGLEHVFFAGDGASAVEVAMKMAYQYWRQIPGSHGERTKFLTLGDAYHGDTLGTVSLGGISRFQQMFEPLLFDVVRGPCPDRSRGPEAMSEAEVCEYYLGEYAQLLDEHAGEIVAVVAESCIQGAAGFVMQPRGFLRGLHRLCRERGDLLILDEIAVGMGRTGKIFAFEHEEFGGERIMPDFVCLGKGLTGGYLAMSATLTTRCVWEAFLGRAEEGKAFLHGHTYGGNPLAAAAGNAVLDLLQGRVGLEFIEKRGIEFGSRLEALRGGRRVRDVRSLGMMGGVEFHRAGLDGRLGSESSRICKKVLNQGVWLRPLGDVIPVLPPVVFEDFDTLFSVLATALDL